MNWNTLNEKEQLNEIRDLSLNSPVLIFKHSTSCGISAMALNRLERKWKDDSIKPYFLDLLSFRDISNEVASTFGVVHQSPQAILIKGGKAIYHSSHGSIDFEEISSIAKEEQTV